MKRHLYILLGAICLALGVVGIAVPGLPTTPLLLAASWFFFRSSARLWQWLINSPLGGYIRSYQRRGGMRLSSKVIAVALMVTMVTSSIIFFIPSTLADWIVGVAGAVGCYVVIFRVPNATNN